MSLRWFVARTNPRCEEKAVNSLTRKGFAAYSPASYSLRLHHRSKAEIERRAPLMVGYAFVGFELGREHFGFARSCDGVAKFLGTENGYVEVPARLIEAVREDEFRGAFVSISPAIVARQEELRRQQKLNDRIAKGAIKLSGGDLVRVTKGVFASRNGVVAKLFGKTRALVQLEGFMGAIQEVNVDIDDIRLCA